jgi:hypothetical protein
MSRFSGHNTDDAVGNLTGRLSQAVVAQTLKWNHENRLLEVKSSTEDHG